MSVLPIVIIWCDVSFENDNSYQPMKDEFNEVITATPKNSLDSIDMAIFNEVKEELSSNNVPIVTVRTVEDAIREIPKHKNKKIFIICSGILGRHLVPEIARQYPYIHDVYIFTSNIAAHLEWAEPYEKILNMFNFPTNLLLRLTRDIADYFIKQGEMFLSVDASQDALKLFNHARNLEIAANVREKNESNVCNGHSYPPPPDFRDHLDLLEGVNGLISRAQEAVREQEYSMETS